MKMLIYFKLTPRRAWDTGVRAGVDMYYLIGAVTSQLRALSQWRRSVLLDP